MFNAHDILNSTDLVALAEASGTELKLEGGVWRGSCPIHGGDNPTAFTVFQGHNGKQMWNCFTRCGSGDAIDFVMRRDGVAFEQACRVLGGTETADPAVVARAAAERAQRERERLEKAIADAQVVLAQLRETEVWLRYHENLQANNQARELWRRRGISDSWQDYFQLGYNPAFPMWDGKESYTSPSLAIPIFEGNWECVNVRHRILQPRDQQKYRPEIKGLPANIYQTNLAEGLDGRVLVVEGEIKSIVTFITLDIPNMQVIGLQGKSSTVPVIDKLKDAQEIVVLLDPDANREALSLAQKLGAQRTRIARFAGKIDDAINDRLIDQHGLRRLIRDAVPPQEFKI